MKREKRGIAALLSIFLCVCIVTGGMPSPVQAQEVWEIRSAELTLSAENYRLYVDVSDTSGSWNVIEGTVKFDPEQVKVKKLDNYHNLCQELNEALHQDLFIQNYISNIADGNKFMFSGGFGRNPDGAGLDYAGHAFYLDFEFINGCKKTTFVLNDMMSLTVTKEMMEVPAESEKPVESENPMESEEPKPTSEPIEGEIPDGFAYQINEAGYAIITGYTGNNTEIVIPQEVEGYPVTEIGRFAFSYCEKLEKITIPESVTVIEENAFFHCTGLRDLKLPDFLTNLPSDMLKECCSLEKIMIPAGVSSISYTVFDGCSSLKSIEVDASNENYISVDGVLYNNDPEVKRISLIRYPEGKPGTAYKILQNTYIIEEHAFFGCSNLESILIPSSVTPISDEAFNGCSSLKAIEVDENNTAVSSINGVLYNKAKTSLMRCPEGIIEKTFQIPKSVTSIWHNAFYGCNGLEALDVSSNVTEIGQYAFANCSNLHSIEISSSVTNLPYGAFLGCDALEDIKLPEQLKQIEPIVFEFCRSLKNVEIPETVTEIGYDAFQECESLKSIVIPSSVTKIEVGVFEGCKSLESVELPEQLTAIGGYAFFDCHKLKSVVIPSTVNEIGICAFTQCYSLENILIPASVTYMESCSDTFYNCTSLEKIDVEKSNQNYSSLDGVLFDKEKTELLKYPENKPETDYQIPEGVREIDEYAVYNCKNLKNIVLSSGVSEIGRKAFSSCDNLTNILIPSSVTVMGEDIFEYCHNTIWGYTDSVAEQYANENGLNFKPADRLESYEENVKLSQYSYRYDGSAKEPEIVIETFLGKLQQDIDYTVAYENNINGGLATVIVTGTGDYQGTAKAVFFIAGQKSTPVDQFERASDAAGVSIIKYKGTEKNVVVPAKIDDKAVQAVGANAFAGAEVETVDLIEGITSIGSGAFSNCKSLQMITIPKTVTEIADDAFADCGQVTLLCYDGSVAQKYAMAHGIRYQLVEDVSVVYGDVDEDGIINSSDALLILQGVVKLQIFNENQMKAADVNGSGEIESADALDVLKKIVKLIDHFNVEEKNI